MPESKPFLTVSEVAVRLGVGSRVVRRMIEEGALPAERLGARLYVRSSDVLAILVGHD